MSPEPGFLMISDNVPATVKDIADYAAMDTKKVSAGLGQLADLGLVAFNGFDCWHVPNWDHRQFESDDTTRRTRAHRESEHS
jgi:hypothetical protein